MAMELCALKIGEHVWKVVSRERKGNILIERVPRYRAEQKTKAFMLDPENDCCLVFCYTRTNQNGVNEYVFVDAGRMVKEHEGRGREETEQAQEGQGQEVHLHGLQAAVEQQGNAGA